MRVFTVFPVALLFLLAGPLLAGDSPQEQRHELMEDVGGAAKAVVSHVGLPEAHGQRAAPGGAG